MLSSQRQKMKFPTSRKKKWQNWTSWICLLYLRSSKFRTWKSRLSTLPDGLKCARDNFKKEKTKLLRMLALLIATQKLKLPEKKHAVMKITEDSLCPKTWRNLFCSQECNSDNSSTASVSLMRKLKVLLKSKKKTDNLLNNTRSKRRRKKLNARSVRETTTKNRCWDLVILLILTLLKYLDHLKSSSTCSTSSTKRSSLASSLLRSQRVSTRKLKENWHHASKRTPTFSTWLENLVSARWNSIKLSIQQTKLSLLMKTTNKRKKCAVKSKRLVKPSNFMPAKLTCCAQKSTSTNAKEVTSTQRLQQTAECRTSTTTEFSRFPVALILLEKAAVYRDF